MALRKHDWNALKQEFFVSEHHEVKPFFRDKGYGVTAKNQLYGTFQKNTKTWRVEKEAHLKAIADKAIEEMADDPEIRKITQQLIEGKKDILLAILRRVEANEKNLNMQELKIALDIVKRELGEPLDFVQSQQLGKDGKPADPQPTKIEIVKVYDNENRTDQKTD